MKKLILLIGLAFPFAAKAQSLTDSLLLRYTFNGNYQDYSGNGYHGTSTSTLTTDSLGNPGFAAYFNGVNSYVDFPNNAHLKQQFPLSFSFWIRADSISSGAYGTVFVTSFDANVHSGLWMSINSLGNIGLSVGNGGGIGFGSRYGRASSATFQDDVWYHVVGIARTGTDIDIYVDCALANGVYDGGSSGTLVYTPGAGSLGRKDSNSVGPEWYFKGALDDFRYWHREITPSEVVDICQEGPAYILSPATEVESLTVYPSPTSDVITFESSAKLLYSTISIYNSTGQLVSTQPYQKTISVAHLSAGVYAATLDSPKGTYTVKFIKQ